MQFGNVLVSVNKEKRRNSTFPNVEQHMRIYLVLLISNCTGERSYFKLKIIENRLRTSHASKQTYLLNCHEHGVQYFAEARFYSRYPKLCSKKSKKSTCLKVFCNDCFSFSFV